MPGTSVVLNNRIGSQRRADQSNQRKPETTGKRFSTFGKNCLRFAKFIFHSRSFARGTLSLD